MTIAVVNRLKDKSYGARSLESRRRLITSGSISREDKSIVIAGLTVLVRSRTTRLDILNLR